ncbi:MAG: 2OG-Fe(II) oxygenase [Rhodospirillales bacterium]|nr:2OG-Fe(II) oxygenase [Rhodospirillales bacterium]
MSGIARVTGAAGTDGACRIGALDWESVCSALDAEGWARVEALLTAEECRAIADLYEHGQHFRSQVVMARHGFGQGEYKYFSYPLPAIVATLRESIYPQLVPVANRWNERMGLAQRYPENLAAMLDRCHQAGQSRPTPLLLRYRAGDYNCLHQDLYGEHIFLLQVAILLSTPDSDFTGGEFVLTEQRPRAQSRVSVVSLNRGDAVVFAVHHRPTRGRRGEHRVVMRHGVSTVRSGQRLACGLIFHDAA